MDAIQQIEKEIREAIVFLREKNFTIPNETIEFMKRASLEKLNWCDVIICKEEVKIGLINFEQLQKGMYVKVVFLDDENNNIKTEETGIIEIINDNKKNFILRHDQKKSSVRIMNKWLELYKLK